MKILGRYTPRDSHDPGDIEGLPVNRELAGPTVSFETFPDRSGLVEVWVRSLVHDGVSLGLTASGLV